MGRYLTELESQLGVVLFERTGRGLRPTDTAHRLAESARAMQAGAQQLARRLPREQTQLTGSVRISASAAVSCLLLPPVLADMRRALPQIQIELVSSNSLSNLLLREADIALRMLRPEQATLVARKLGQVEVGLFASREYLQNRGTPRCMDDILNHELIGNDSLDTIVRGAKAQGYAIKPQHFSLRCDDLMVHWHAVCAGYGLGFLGIFQGKAAPQLVRLLPELNIPPMPVWLVVHREIRTNPLIRASFDFLAQSIPERLALP